MTAVVDVTGRLRKMPAEANSPVSYSLLLGETRVPLNDLVGHSLRLDFEGVIRCIN